MKFVDAIKEILTSAARPMTPQEIREVIKKEHPEFYGTRSHIANVEKGHYQSFDHALLAQIYIVVGESDKFICDKRVKPMKVSLQVKDAVKPSSIRYPILRNVPKIKSQTEYNEKIIDLLNCADQYHLAYYRSETFGGPSLYFHLRALDTRNDPCSTSHLEYVYATLASWGMHRMGPGGSKMQAFRKFQESILTLGPRIAEAQKFNYNELDEQKWSILKGIFFGTDVMASGTKLVGNSKVMHHMLPNVVPPIDRSYTLRFLQGNTNIKNDVASEWQLMRSIITEFFIPVASDAGFQEKAEQWMGRKDEFPWDTSIMKIVDNLIIGALKT